MGAKHGPLSERFWRHVKPGEPGECWEWTGAARKGTGYGTIRAGHGAESKMVRAHRASWELAYGPVPDGIDVLHQCDNPLCVNPNHLFLGTQQDNMSDMVTKGRSNNRHKLTEEQVAEIRRLYAEGGITQREVGEKFGVSSKLVSHIMCARCWTPEGREARRRQRKAT